MGQFSKSRDTPYLIWPTLGPGRRRFPVGAEGCPESVPDSGRPWTRSQAQITPGRLELKYKMVVMCTCTAWGEVLSLGLQDF